MRIPLLQTGLLALATSLWGCSTPLHCDSLGKCGGDFLGAASSLGGPAPSQEWVSSSLDACIDTVPSPPSPPQLALIPPRPAGTRAVEPSTIDWCSNVVFSAKGAITSFDDGWYEVLSKYNGWFPGIPLYTAQLEVDQANQYTLTTVQLVSEHVDLSSTCLWAQGVRLSCDDVAKQLESYVSTRLNSFKGFSLKAVVYDSSCADAADNGCSCGYNVQLTATTQGPWTAANGQISFFDSNAAPPSQVDYCVKGADFLMSGTKETDLFNRTSLKTLDMRAPSCSDGVQSKTLGEEGVDCGGKCNKPCN